MTRHGGEGTGHIHAHSHSRTPTPTRTQGTDKGRNGGDGSFQMQHTEQILTYKAQSILREARQGARKFENSSTHRKLSAYPVAELGQRKHLKKTEPPVNSTAPEATILYQPRRPGILSFTCSLSCGCEKKTDTTVDLLHIRMTRNTMWHMDKQLVQTDLAGGVLRSPTHLHHKVQ